ncbi:flagellar filament capping protein FliD [Paraburkholderia sp. C35]|uniref:flagellar filament capping protein FliD n=1 Tax=Paraburkholderia sp. C35 TaxID=2126993 RepID=UPI000D68C379|nr:flagellar filament capping protein FliD [Paraburkholderia sp. C35]
MSSIYDTPGLQSAVQSIISGSTSSGTDVAAIVNALVTSKVAGQGSILASKQALAKTQTSAIGALKGALSALQDAARALNSGAMSSYVGKADGKGLAATTGKDAVAGSYSVTVDAIATAQSISSGAFDAKAPLGEGTLKLTVGGKDITVAIDSTNNTLAGIATAINKAAGGTGVTATIVNGTDGAHLVLRSTETGVEKGISVAVTLANGSTDAGLSRLNVASSVSTVDPRDPGKTVSPHTAIDPASGWTQSVAGQDASLVIAGMRVTSASNKVENAINGVTLSLGAEAVGTTQTLSIERDIAAQKASITAFVDAYNKYIGTAAALTAFDPAAAAGSQAGPLLGDSMMNTIRGDLASLISKGVASGTGTVSLGAIGVSLQADGKLAIDDAALTSALTNSPDKVATLFNESTGVAAMVAGRVETFVKSNGVIDSRLQSISAEVKNYTEQQKRLASYAETLTNQYNAQFTALNNLMAQMNNNARYLTQLFGGDHSSGTLNAR